MVCGMATTFDFSAARAECEAKDLFWSQEFEREADKQMAGAALTQSQVDVVTRLHLDYVCWLFSPQTYRWTQRIALAWHFLFGKGLR